MSRVCCLFLSVYSLLLLTEPALAQYIPPRLEERLDFDIDEDFPTLDNLNPLYLPSGTEQDRIDGPRVIFVQSITTSGVQIFDSEEINAVLEPYINRFLPVSELPKIEQDIIKLYESAGYIGSGAFITPKSSFNGDRVDLQLHVVELKISDLKISGSERLKPFVRNRLKGTIDQPFNINQLSNRLRFLLNDPRIDQLDATITRSTPEMNRRNLELEVDPAKPFKLSALVNNARSPAIGSLERGINFEYLNVLGLGDTITLDFRNTDGSNIIAAGYSLPLTSKGGELALDYLFGDSNIVEYPFDVLNLRSKTHIFSLDFLEPVLQRSSNTMLQELKLGFGFTRTETKSTLDSIPFPLSEGANEFGSTRSTKLSFQQDYLHRTLKNTFKLRSKFSLGLDLGSTNSEAFEDGEFFKWEGEGLFASQLSKRWVVISTVSAQVADRNLISNEQYVLGGFGSVRGLRKNKISRNNGFAIQQEIRHRAIETPKHQLNVVSFFDFAYGWNGITQLSEEDEALASFGFGISYLFRDDFLVNIEYAIPVLGENRSTNSLQEQGVLFSIQWSL